MSRADIRRPEVAEAAAIHAFFHRCLSTSLPFFPARAMDDYGRQWREEVILERVTRSADVLFVAYGGAEIVGMVSGTEPEGGVGTIVWMLVDPPWQGRGIGRELYKVACNAYRSMGAHKMKLTAPTEEARMFYERCGMRVEGHHTDHWYHLDFTSLAVTIHRTP